MNYQVSSTTYQVVFSREQEIVQTLEGAVKCFAGDAIITGIKGESWAVPRDAFFRKYDPVPGVIAGENGTYKKHLAFVEARQLEETEQIVLADDRGTLTGQSGSWCLTYGLGNQAFIQADIFATSYVPSKSIPVYIGVERCLLGASHTKMVSLESGIRSALPSTPIFIVPIDADTETAHSLWFQVVTEAKENEDHAISSSAVLEFRQLFTSDGANSLVKEILRRQEKSIQTVWSFTVQRFLKLLFGPRFDSGDASEMEVIAMQLFAVNEFNEKLQNDGKNDSFIGSNPSVRPVHADDELRRVGAIADLLAGESQTRWQQLVLAVTKEIAKPFSVFRLFWSSSLVTMGMLGALSLASFSELSEGCDSGDVFAWTGCTTEWWKHWFGACAFSIYVCALIVAWRFYAQAKVRRDEGKHQDYRLMAECLRVQYVLSALGDSACVVDEFTAGKNVESSWVLLALRALSSETTPERKLRIIPSDANEWAMKNFVDDQKDYHDTTLIKRREDAIQELSRAGQWGAIFFFACLFTLAANVLFKFSHHDAGFLSPMGQHFLLIFQVVSLAFWATMRKVIDTFALEQEAHRGEVVLLALRRVSPTDRQSIVAAAKFFAKDQVDWHALHRSKPIEAAVG